MTMKKKCLLLLGIFSFGISHAQVGINTQNPQGIFHIDGKSDNSSVPTVTQQLNDFVILSNGNVGIGTLNPSAKLVIEDGATAANPKSVLKIVDSNVKKDRVMTAINSNGEATWQDYEYQGKIGQVYSTTSLPAQTFPAAITAINGWSFTIPEEGYYAFDVRWWATYSAVTSGAVAVTATHFYLNVNGTTMDQYETYNTINTSLGNRLTAYFPLYFDATAADVGKTVTISVRPGISPASAGQSTQNNTTIPWTTSKITVKRMDI